MKSLKHLAKKFCTYLFHINSPQLWQGSDIIERPQKVISTAWFSEICSLTSLDACTLGASSDVREPTSLHQDVRFMIYSPQCPASLHCQKATNVKQGAVYPAAGGSHMPKILQAKWWLCALGHAIQNSVEAILACHPALSIDSCHITWCLWKPVQLDGYLDWLQMRILIAMNLWTIAHAHALSFDMIYSDSAVSKRNQSS